MKNVSCEYDLAFCKKKNMRPEGQPRPLRPANCQRTTRLRRVFWWRFYNKWKTSAVSTTWRFVKKKHVAGRPASTIKTSELPKTCTASRPACGSLYTCSVFLFVLLHVGLSEEEFIASNVWQCVPFVFRSRARGETCYTLHSS